MTYAVIEDINIPAKALPIANCNELACQSKEPEFMT